MSNIEADSLSNLVINCETPNEVYVFTSFLAVTSEKMGVYQKTVKEIQEKFTKYIESEAPLCLKKDENGVYLKDDKGQPVALEGKEEDWKNIFQGAHERMGEELNALGNTVEEYECSKDLMKLFQEVFSQMSLKNYIGLQKDTQGINRTFLIVYLIFKRLIDATKA